MNEWPWVPVYDMHEQDTRGWARVCVCGQGPERAEGTPGQGTCTPVPGASWGPLAVGRHLLTPSLILISEAYGEVGYQPSGPKNPSD